MNKSVLMEWWLSRRHMRALAWWCNGTRDLVLMQLNKAAQGFMRARDFRSVERCYRLAHAHVSMSLEVIEHHVRGTS